MVNFNVLLSVKLKCGIGENEFKNIKIILVFDGISISALWDTWRILKSVKLAVHSEWLQYYKISGLFICMFRHSYIENSINMCNCNIMLSIFIMTSSTFIRVRFIYVWNVTGDPKRHYSSFPPQMILFNLTSLLPVVGLLLRIFLIF